MLGLCSLVSGWSKARGKCDEVGGGSAVAGHGGGGGAGDLRPWDFPGKSTGVGRHCLLRLQCYKPLIRLLMSVASVEMPPSFISLFFFPDQSC